MKNIHIYIILRYHVIETNNKKQQINIYLIMLATKNNKQFIMTKWNEPITLLYLNQSGYLFPGTMYIVLYHSDLSLWYPV